MNPNLGYGQWALPGPPVGVGVGRSRFRVWGLGFRDDMGYMSVGLEECAQLPIYMEPNKGPFLGFTGHVGKNYLSNQEQNETPQQNSANKEQTKRHYHYVPTFLLGIPQNHTMVMNNERQHTIR